ncbi:TPA: hypothetical protein ACX6S0_000559 [Photobacterium damselae]
MKLERPPLKTIGSTVAACEAIVEHLKPEIEGDGRQPDRVAVVERHIGRFDTADEIKRWVTGRDGGVRVAALSVPKMENRGGRLVGTVNFVAYIVATEMWGFSRDVRAEVIAGRTAKRLSIKGWAKGIAESGVERLSASNLYSGVIDKLGVSIWSVTWTQDWLLDTELDLNSLDEFKRFNVKMPVRDGAPILEGMINPNELYEQAERVEECCNLGFEDEQDESSTS